MPILHGIIFDTMVAQDVEGGTCDNTFVSLSHDSVVDFV